MFDLSNISTYLVPSVVILCLLVGYIIKNLIPNDSINRFIPLIVGVLGVAATIFTAVTTGVPITVDVVVAGLSSGLASTGLLKPIKIFSTVPIKNLNNVTQGSLTAPFFISNRKENYGLEKHSS